MTAPGSMIGLTGHHAGLAAEAQVVRHYLRAGHSVVAQRWRGQGGEIDLVMQQCGRYVFVEVKSARNFATAATKVTARQLIRLAAAADEFLSGVPGGLGNEIRFDVALVDRQGQIEILENALIDS